MKKSWRGVMISALICLIAAIVIAVVLTRRPLHAAVLAILLFAVCFGVVSSIRAENKAALTALRDRVLDRRKDHTPSKPCKEARFFAVTALIAGLMLVFLSPPLTVPDEPVHYYNAYLVSEGAYADSLLSGKTIDSLPRAVTQLTNPARYTAELQVKYSYAQMEVDRHTAINPADRTSYDMLPYTPNTNPVGYLAAGFGMWFFRHLSALFRLSGGSSPYINLLYGRIGNLLLYVLLITIAIRLIPFYKKTVTLIALMPMCLFQAASVSYDVPLIAASVLLCAQVLALCMNTGAPIRPREVVTVMLCTFILAGIKGAAYLPLLSILLVIPLKKYHGVKTFVLCVAAVLVAAAVGYLPGVIIGRNSAALVATAPEIEAQKQWFMGHLTRFPAIMINTVISKFDFFVNGIWGTLGWLDTRLPQPALLLGLIVLIILAVRETCAAAALNFGWKRLWILPGPAISGVMIFVSMYLYHTPLPVALNTVGGNIVEGVQGRYFIPLLLPMVIFFANGSFSWLTKGKADTTDTASMWITVLGGIFSAVMTVLFVLLRFWI